MFHASYRAFGLTIASEIELPELPIAEEAAAADVLIRLDDTPEKLDGAVEIEPWVTARPGAMHFDFGVARFLIQSGREIVVTPTPGRSQRDIRAYLLGSAVGALLHQRGILPLHANAVRLDDRAIAFIGPSGSGKSTLAAHLLDAGVEILCDDICAVTFDAAGCPMAWPGIPRIKLWSDALAAFGRGSEGLEPVLDRDDKFSLPVPGDSVAGPLPLTRIYVLAQASPGVSAEVRPLQGAEAFAAVKANVYREEFALPLGQAPRLFDNLLRLSRFGRVFAAERNWGLDRLAEESERLLSHMMAETRCFV
ncbi:MAG TPA: hypothetical protein VGN38_12525 [Caulobacteraceae bacterium]|nr:hypothetical protein [Caulobacteraceae bacterium]